VFGSLLRPVAFVAVLAAVCAYGTIMLRGPQGLDALREKHRQIRILEEQNADLEHQIQLKKERISHLKSDPDTQELEIRKRMKMQRQGDTQFVLPEAQPGHPDPSSTGAQ
jgi:cell division protein FtsB